MKKKSVNFLEDSAFLQKAVKPSGLLGEKLVTVLKAKMEDRKNSYNDSFRFYLQEKNNVCVNMEMRQYCINYNWGDNVQPEGEGWGWFYVTGPSMIEELYHAFDKDVPFFKFAYDYWIGIHENTQGHNYAELAELDDVSFTNKMNTVGIILSLKDIAEEYMSGDYYREDDYELDDGFEESDEFADLGSDGSVEVHTAAGVDDDTASKGLVDVMKAFFYAAWYIDEFVYGTEFPEDRQKEFETYFSKVYNGGGSDEDVWDYMDYFLDEMSNCLDMDASAYPIVLPITMSGFFSLETNYEGTTPRVLVYKSEHMKEYRDMKEKYPDSLYVNEIDKLIPCLEDPANINERAYRDDFISYDVECILHNGYSKEEYVCAICHFDESENGVFFNPLFKEIRERFESLFTAYKAECEEKERKAA